MEERLTNLETRFAVFIQEMQDFKQEMRDFKTEMRQQNEMRAAEIRALDKKLQDQSIDTDTKLRAVSADIQAKSEATDAKIQALSASTDAKVADIRKSVDDMGKHARNITIAVIIGVGAMVASAVFK